MRLQGHAGRIAALTVIGTAIVLPLVVFVLGPNMPPGNRTTGASSQVNDNTVLLVVMTPFTVFILVYLFYAVFVFRAAPGRSCVTARRSAGTRRSQIAWLVATSAAVLFLAIFGTAELFASNGSGGGEGPKPIAKPSGSVLPVQVIAQQWEFTYRYPTYGGVETAAARSAGQAADRVPRHVDRRDPFLLGLRARREGRRQSRRRQRRVRQGEDDRRLPDSLRRALRALARLHVRHRARRRRGAVHLWIASQRKEFTPVQKYLPPYALTYSPDPQDRAG